MQSQELCVESFGHNNLFLAVQWNPFYHGYRNKIRKQLQGFRVFGEKMVKGRISLVQTDDSPPNDVLTTYVKALCKQK